MRLAGRDYPAHAVAVEDPAGVAEGLATLLSRRPHWARAYGVALDTRGRPVRADCERKAQEIVLVRTTLRG